MARSVSEVLGEVQAGAFPQPPLPSAPPPPPPPTEPEQAGPGGLIRGPDGFMYTQVWDPEQWNPEGIGPDGKKGTFGNYTYKLAQQYIQEAYGVIGGGGAGPSPLSMSTDPALLRLEAQAREQAMELAASQEARAVEAHPVQMAQAQSQMQLEEQNFQRQLLSDKFTVAQGLWDSAQLADQLAAAKRKNAADALTGLVDYLVPPGMEYIPGMEPGGLSSQIFEGAGYDYTPQRIMPGGTIDFSQFTQGLSPETDEALRYLQQTGQQTAAGLGTLR